MIDEYKDILDNLLENSLYRNLRSVSIKGKKAIVNSNECINFSSNDYLGLSQNKSVLAKTSAYLKEKHISQCSSRLISGNDPILSELESKLALHRRTESSLLYPTGYMANIGVVATIATKDFTIISDEFNHASIIDACKLSGAKVQIFRHNNIEDLELKLIHHKDTKKIVIFEGIYSMDGDLAKLKQITNLSKKYNAITILDDAHGDFIFGSKSNPFGGTAEYENVNNMIDIHISSLSKALGCFGGYVATSNILKEYLVNKSRPFIFTSSLPDHIGFSCLIAMEIARSGYLQKKLFNNISYLIREFDKIGININSKSQIIPIIIGDEKKAVEVSEYLLRKGIFLQSIRYPTVEMSKARLRLSVSAFHNKEDIDILMEELSFILKENKIL